MTEPNLGPLFKGPLPETKLDADAIIRASRRRRRPRFIAFAAAAVIVVGGVGGVGVGLLGGGVNAAGSAGPNHPPAIPASGARVPTPGVDHAGPCQMQSGIPGYTVLCGCAAVSLPPAATNLTAQVSFPAEREGQGTAGVITITNAGSSPVSANAATPMGFFITQGMIESSLGTADSAGHDVQLEPGKSMSLAIPFPNIGCAGGKALPGTYQLAGVVDLILPGNKEVQVVAPAVTVTITR